MLRDMTGQELSINAKNNQKGCELYQNMKINPRIIYLEYF